MHQELCSGESGGIWDMICLSNSFIDISTMGQQTFCQEDCIQCNGFSILSRKKTHRHQQQLWYSFVEWFVFESEAKQGPEQKSNHDFSLRHRILRDNLRHHHVYLHPYHHHHHHQHSHSHENKFLLFSGPESESERVQEKNCFISMESCGIGEVTFLYYKRPDKCIKGGFSFRYVN